jgi:hypothetical protein
MKMTGARLPVPDNVLPVATQCEAYAIERAKEDIDFTCFDALNRPDIKVGAFGESLLRDVLTHAQPTNVGTNGFQKF